MSIHETGYAVLPPEAQHWRESNLMKIPNTNLLDQLGGAAPMGCRLWRLPPYSANTWHRHVQEWELYFVLQGKGRIRVGEQTLTIERHGCVLVAPDRLRQIFNDTGEEVLWLIVGAPRESASLSLSDIYPEEPTSLPAELAGRVWPPR